jgi:hypothetical protein
MNLQWIFVPGTRDYWSAAKYLCRLFDSVTIPINLQIMCWDPVFCLNESGFPKHGRFSISINNTLGPDHAFEGTLERAKLYAFHVIATPHIRALQVCLSQFTNTPARTQLQNLAMACAIEGKMRETIGILDILKISEK